MSNTMIITCPKDMSFSTGLLRSTRNDVLGERGKKEAVVTTLPPQVVIASNAKQPRENNSSPKGLLPFLNQPFPGLLLSQTSVGENKYENN